MDLIKKKKGLTRCIKRLLIFGYGKEAVTDEIVSNFVFYVLLGDRDEPEYPVSEKTGSLLKTEVQKWAEIKLNKKELSKFRKIFLKVEERRALKKD